MGVDAKVHTLSPIYYLDFTMKENQSFVQSVPSDYTCFVYTLSGEVFFSENSTKGLPHTTLVFENNGDQVSFKTEGQVANFVLIAGKPIGEPIVQHGPFVMNTKEEVNLNL